MNQIMHKVRLIRPFKHGGKLFEGQCDLTDEQYQRAARFGLVDGKVETSKPEAKAADVAAPPAATDSLEADSPPDAPESDDTKTSEEADPVDTHQIVMGAILQLAGSELKKKPNVKDIEDLIGFDISAADRDAAWKECKAVAEQDNRDASSQIETR